MPRKNAVKTVLKLVLSLKSYNPKIEAQNQFQLKQLRQYLSLVTTSACAAVQSQLSHYNLVLLLLFSIQYNLWHQVVQEDYYKK